jgi:hypothetical protein
LISEERQRLELSAKCSLRRHSEPVLERGRAGLPRMAGFARFGEAVGRGLGWQRETFPAAYMDNRQHATISTLEDLILANLLLKYVEMTWGLLEWSI